MPGSDRAIGNGFWENRGFNFQTQLNIPSSSLIGLTHSGCFGAEGIGDQGRLFFCM